MPRTAKRDLRFYACLQCGRAAFEAAALQAALAFDSQKRWSDPAHEPTPCDRCGAQQTPIAWSGGGRSLTGAVCGGCDLGSTSLARLAGLFSRENGKNDERVPAITTPVEGRRSRKTSATRQVPERDRAFAFFFLAPLELGEDISRPHFIGWTVLVLVVMFGLEVLSLGAIVDVLGLRTAEVSWRSSYQVVTAFTMHSGLFHLVGNLYFLYFFGRVVEHHLGAGRTALALLLCEVASSLASLSVRLGEDIVVIGASGGISGLLGCYAVLFPLRQVGLSLWFTVLRVPALLYFAGWFYLQYQAGVQGGQAVAYEAHIAGFVAGLGSGLLLKRWR